jgi:hypothetical protein
MPVTLNASTSSGLVQTADTSGTVEIQSNGTTRLTVASDGVTATNLTSTGNTSISNLTATGTFGGGVITSGTVNGGAANPLSGGTTVNFTGIPSWVKRITVILNAVSTNGTSLPIIQIGTSSGVEATGYLSTAQDGAASGNSTVGYLISRLITTSSSFTGNAVLCKVSGDTWICSGDIAVQPTVSANVESIAGSKTLSGTLDRVRITTEGGVNTFDAGTINIFYEG